MKCCYNIPNCIWFLPKINISTVICYPIFHILFSLIVCWNQAYQTKQPELWSNEQEQLHNQWNPKSFQNLLGIVLELPLKVDKVEVCLGWAPYKKLLDAVCLENVYVLQIKIKQNLYLLQPLLKYGNCGVPLDCGFDCRVLS